MWGWAMSRTMSFYDLRDALAQPGCAVCRLKADSANQFLDTLLWEHVNDPGTRRDIRRARGFCREHAWGLVRPGASLGVALIMRDVLQSALKLMASASFQALPFLSLQRLHEALASKQPTSATADLVARLGPQAMCPACKQAKIMERIYLDTLLDALLGEDGLLAAYESSDGLCLPHFRQALTQVRSEAVFEALINAQRAIWERLATDLSEFIRKNAYRFRDEPLGEEGDAWLRAVAALAGSRPERGES